MRADEMVMLPWTFRGPRQVTDAQGTRVEMRVVELPGFVMEAGSESELRGGLRKALRYYLESLISAGQTPTLPAGKPVRYWVSPSRWPGQVSPPRAESYTGTPIAPFTLTLLS